MKPTLRCALPDRCAQRLLCAFVFITCLRQVPRAASARHLQAEYVASYPEKVVPRTYLPVDHPIQSQENTPGLPEGCITYEEKYAEYENLGKGKMLKDPNELHPFSRFVVIVRMHYGISWRWDLMLHLRSLMTEASRSGMHIFLLYEDSARPEAAPDDTPEKFWHSIPLEFRAISFLFDESDIHNAYPKMHKYKKHAREYLPLVWFLHRYPGYKFTWYVEYDVRYTGRSLGNFLNAALQKAIVVPKQEQPDDGRKNSRKLHLVGAVNSSAPMALEPVGLPDDEAALPDLLVMGDGVHTLWDTKPRDYEPQHWNFSQTHHRQVQVMGISRNLADALHKYSVDGFGGFIEEFVPSLAVETNLTVVSIPIAEFDGGSFHCCYKNGEAFYQGWFTSRNCRQAALLHPVKLEDRVWKEQDVRHQSSKSNLTVS